MRKYNKNTNELEAAVRKSRPQDMKRKKHENTEWNAAGGDLLGRHDVGVLFREGPGKA